MKRCGPSFLIGCAALLCSCTSTVLLPVSDRNFTQFDEDERGIWQRSAEQEQAINTSGFIYEDPALDAYLNTIAKRLQPTSVYERIPFALTVIRDPSLNAFAMPNGAIYVHTGILASLENEAQLAALIAHEMTHATHRHAVKKQRDSKNRSAVMASLGAATGGLGMVLGPVVLSSAYGYSRDLEREADREGFQLLINAGYELAESTRVFERIKEVIEEEEVSEPFFFGTHPRIIERIEHYQELIKVHSGSQAGRYRNEEQYRSQVRPLLLENARLNIAVGRYKRAESALLKYARSYPFDTQAYYLLGEAYRKQGGDDSLQKAREQYNRVLELDPLHVETHKMLGLVLFKSGDFNSARRYLATYLELNAGAPDRSYIEDYILQCQRSK